MTDDKLLALLSDFYTANKNMIHILSLSMWHLKYGDEQDQLSWDCLFQWCEAKDTRDEIAVRLKPYNLRAYRLKEGLPV